MKIRNSLLLIASFLTASCINNTDRITQLSWLQGTWERNYNNVLQIEEWKIQSNELVGQSIFITNQDSTTLNSYTIKELNSQVTLFITPTDFEESTSYPLSYFSADSVVFKNNQESWPQEIVMVKKADSVYVKSLSGHQQQMFNAVHFSFKKN